MQNAIKHIHSELQGLYPETEIRSFCNLIVEKLTGFSRTEITLNKNTVFSEKQHHRIESFIEKLKNFVPIQYILGETEFYGLPFTVNDSVLIPRPETEELVAWIENENKKSTGLKILDIGTGSGCIAISLKSIFPNATIDAFDVSDNALKTARLNALLNKLNVSFAEVDILKDEELFDRWNIIVSNPPYITEHEKRDISPNVLNFEPHLALFVPDEDPLLFYRHIALFAYKHLFPGGKLYFEINREYGKEVIDLLIETGFHNVELRKDISGNDRMAKGELTQSSVY